MKKTYLLSALALSVLLLSCTKASQRTDTQEELTQSDDEESYDNGDYYYEDEIHVVSSPDGVINLYSNHLSGSVYFGWSNRYTVKDRDSVYTYDGLPDWESEVSSINKIYTFPHPKRHLYLFDAYFREWGSMGYRYFVAFERIGHDLKRVNLLRDDAGNPQCEIGFEYNTPDYYFRFARTLGDENLYLWDEKSATFYYPLQMEDSYLMTDRFVRYIWNGKTLFPTTDTIANPRLYASLRDYVICLQHTNIGDVQVRIDSLPDGRLRYAAWNRNQSINIKPETILYGERINNEFHFYNETSTYVVTHENIPEIRIYHSPEHGQLGNLVSVCKEEQ